jgi:hypothetical protein
MTEGNVCGRIGAPAPSGSELTIEVSEDDLRAIAERDYEGAASTDHDQQAQAVGLVFTDTLFANLTA